MRREEKEIKDRQIIDQLLYNEYVCRIAFANENIPYIVPLNFGYDGEFIYIHSASKGKKIDILKENKQVSFELESKVELVTHQQPCKFTMNYYSVIGSGIATFINNIDEKRKAFDIIMKKFSIKPSFTYSEASLNAVTMIKIKINEITGKKSGY